MGQLLASVTDHAALPEYVALLPADAETERLAAVYVAAETAYTELQQALAAAVRRQAELTDQASTPEVVAQWSAAAREMAVLPDRIGAARRVAVLAALAYLRQLWQAGINEARRLDAELPPDTWRRPGTAPGVRLEKGARLCNELAGQRYGTDLQHPDTWEKVADRWARSALAQAESISAPRTAALQ